MSAQKRQHAPQLLLSLEALGVVFGDIGTNVLFALRAAFHGPYAVPATPANVLGVLSLVLWALLLVVSVKYLGFIMRADNRGEGGTFALLALLRPRPKAQGVRWYGVLVSIGLLGAALLYGDGVITPAISVLSAVEGLGLAAPGLAHLVVPITVGILVALFLVQRHGTGRLGVVFGPLMLAWFGTLAALGLRGIALAPQVLVAVNPGHAVRFLAHSGPGGFFVLGVVILVVAGAEALYADMGHFGRAPIRHAWGGVVLPALVLNYFGQGALLLRDGGEVQHLFYRLAPTWAQYPLILLATMATIIASQALISGAFSLTRQAIQLGYLPRMRIEHTSARIPGRIFIPGINWMLMALCLALVLGFRESSRLAAAYGMSVIGTMLATTLLFAFVARVRWRWSLLRVGALTGLFLLVDLSLLGANLVKVVHGAWIPLGLALLVYTLMVTWREGGEALRRKFQVRDLTVQGFLEEIEEHHPVRLPGTGVFLTPSPHLIPSSLHHMLDRLPVLHEKVVLLSILTEDVPRVPEAERVRMKQLDEGVWQLTAHYGFMETPTVVELLACCPAQAAMLAFEKATFFVGHVTLLTTGHARMPHWRKALFAFLWRNARSAVFAFRIPPQQVVELGIEVQL